MSVILSEHRTLASEQCEMRDSLAQAAALPFQLGQTSHQSPGHDLEHFVVNATRSDGWPRRWFALCCLSSGKLAER